MEIVKELSEIAESWTEPEYRARPELSYSTLSTYLSLGYNGLDHLFDKKESPSLSLGSAVDAIITGGQQEFNDNFLVCDAKVTDGGLDTCNVLVDMQLPFNSFEEIPEDIVSQAAKQAEFWKADKWDKVRYKKVLETGDIAEYYNMLISSDKQVISSDMYQDVLACVKALKESSATAGYFADNDPFSPVRRYYQLKFKAEFDGVGYRNMADELVCDYDRKIVYPIDLKTSSTPEWDFEKSFIKWHYYIQAVLYWSIIRNNMDKDPYFKDFKLDDYRFIVVNPKTLTPLVWKFPLTQEKDTLVDSNGNEWPSPFEIGKELRGYLDCKPPVPNGINLEGVNIISCLKKA